MGSPSTTSNSRSSPTQIPGTTWSTKKHHSGANNSGFAVMQET